MCTFAQHRLSPQTTKPARRNSSDKGSDEERGRGEEDIRQFSAGEEAKIILRLCVYVLGAGGKKSLRVNYTQFFVNPSLKPLLALSACFRRPSWGGVEWGNGH